MLTRMGERWTRCTCCACGAERLPSRMAPPLVPSMRALKQFLLTSWASPKQIPLYRRTVIFIRGFHG